MPGPVTRGSLVLGFILCFLDCACWLPHPAAPLPTFELLKRPSDAEVALQASEAESHLINELKARAGAPVSGLPSFEVRKNYKQRLSALAVRLQEHNRNATLMTLSAACRLAAVASHERQAARIEARLQGSAASHLGLQLRDLFVYRSLDPFSLENMMKTKRSKMEKKLQEGSAAPSDNDVCLGLVESSTRSNQGWDEAAEAASTWQMSYILETALLYASVFSVVAAMTYVSEVLYRRAAELKSKKNDD